MYKDTKQCLKCKHEVTLELTRIEAAFESEKRTKFWKAPCKKCGEKKEFCGSLAHSEFDEELFEIWETDENKYFSYQDEDMEIADSCDLNLILKYIDSDKCLLGKKLILYNALLFKALDIKDTSKKGNKNTSKLFDQALEALKQHSGLIDQDKEGVIWDYMLEKISPYLKKSNNTFNPDLGDAVAPLGQLM